MTDAVKQISSALGSRIREAREQRAFTLDHLAKRSGVSRRMIVNIEGGKANASIATLLRLADALQTSLAALVAGQAAESRSVVTRADECRSLWQGPAGGSAELIAAAEMLELWNWRLQPDERYESDAHHAGTRELLHVHSGRLLVTIAEADHLLGAGDGMSFFADVPHSYACVGRRSTHFAMTVLEPMSRMRP